MTDMEQVREDIRSHVEEELVRDTEMAVRISQLEEKLDKAVVQIETLLNLWQNALGIVTFIKWAAAISGSLVGVFIFFKEHWK